MTFASSSDVSDLKDKVYGLDLQLRDLFERLERIEKAVQEIEAFLNRNKLLGRLK